MNIKLYGMATCSRCKTAKMMLEKRKELLEQKGATIEFIDLTAADDVAGRELPFLVIDGKDTFVGKASLLKIREFKP